MLLRRQIGCLDDAVLALPCADCRARARAERAVEAAGADGRARSAAAAGRCGHPGCGRAALSVSGSAGHLLDLVRYPHRRPGLRAPGESGDPPPPASEACGVRYRRPSACLELVDVQLRDVGETAFRVLGQIELVVGNRVALRRLVPQLLLDGPVGIRRRRVRREACRRRRPLPRATGLATGALRRR